MAEGTEEEHGAHARDGDCRGDDHCELLEGDQLAAEEGNTAAEGCDGSTEDADAHLGVGLLDSQVSSSFDRVRVIRGQMDYIVNSQSYQDDHTDRL